MLHFGNSLVSLSPPVGGGARLRHLSNHQPIRKEKNMKEKRQQEKKEILTDRTLQEGKTMTDKNRRWSGRRRWTGTIRYLGPDRQHGRRVYLCLGPYGYFVSSRKSYGCLTNRTASLKLAGIRPSKITLDLAIRLMDKIDKRYFRNNDE